MDMVLFKPSATPPTRPSRLRASLPKSLAVFFHVFRQRIHLAIHPVNELAGVSQRLFEMHDAGGQVRVVGDLSDTVKG